MRAAALPFWTGAKIAAREVRVLDDRAGRTIAMKVKKYWLPQLALALVAAFCLSACGSLPGTGTSTPTIQAAAVPPVPLAQAKFAFAPVTGAPASLLNSISSQLGKEAFAQHVTLVPSGDVSATYVVKGYLSAVGDVSGTILVYVWDIFDTSGRRVHRISGQETTAGGSAVDPWAGVDNATTSNVARRTIASIVAWGSQN
jgi:hypothetical protein